DGWKIAADRLEQRRFTAPGRSEQDESIRPEHLEIDAVRCRHQVLLGLVLQRHAFDIEQRRSVHAFLLPFFVSRIAAPRRYAPLSDVIVWSHRSNGGVSETPADASPTC